MECDFKYNLSHIGDILVEGMEALFRPLASVTDLCRLMSRCELAVKRPIILKKMGARLEKIRIDTPDHPVFDDEKLHLLVEALERLAEKSECQSCAPTPEQEEPTVP